MVVGKMYRKVNFSNVIACCIEGGRGRGINRLVCWREPPRHPPHSHFISQPPASLPPLQHGMVFCFGDATTTVKKGAARGGGIKPRKSWVEVISTHYLALPSDDVGKTIALHEQQKHMRLSAFCYHIAVHVPYHAPP